VVGAVGGRRVAQEPSVGERRVERPRILVAAIGDEPGDRTLVDSTSATMSMIGLAARPGTAVDPM
jgi:hypothetical protein